MRVFFLLALVCKKAECSHSQRHMTCDVVVVECGPGSFYASELRACVPCEEGSYQPQPGRDHCLRCPPRHTTYGRGARLRLECCTFTNRLYERHYATAPSQCTCTCTCMYAKAARSLFVLQITVQSRLYYRAMTSQTFQVLIL